MQIFQITIIGTGYVGLVTGACFAQMGHSVLCLDIDQKKIQDLQKGEIPFVEPDLKLLVQKNIEAGRLAFTTDYAKAIAFGNLCFFALPTPSTSEGTCDISYLEEAARAVGTYMEESRLIVNKSTAPVGTVFHIRQIISEKLAERGKEISFEVASNPEFLKEGAAVRDCLNPDRIVIGTNHSHAAQILSELYSILVENPEQILVMDPLSAEMTKYASNAMLATRISFMNEMASICKRVGADINEVRKGMGLDARIGPHFLSPGIGYGGSCFPKDLRALIATAKNAGCTPDLLQAVDQVNIAQKKLLGKSILNYFSHRGGIEGKIIAVWGLSFKPETDDMREAPSLAFIEELLELGAKLRLFDPVAMPRAQQLVSHEQITWCQSETEAACGADAIALLTEWKQFQKIDLRPVRKQMKGIAFFDGRNHYHPLTMKEKGFDYIGIGVPDQLQSL